MSTITFDTHAFVKRLTATGMPEQQAETVTALVKEAQDASSGDLATKRDIAQLQRDIAQLEALTKAALAETKADLLKWMFGALAAQTAFLSLIKFFGH